MTNFYISDTHFFHANIMKFCPETRPYDTVEEMNDHLIESWNSVVTDKDDVFFGGDFALGKFNDADLKKVFGALKGRIHMVYGNHDPKNVRNLPWASQQHYIHQKINGRKLFMFHFPIAAGHWDSAHYGSIHLYGHVHGKKVYDKPCRALDVGVDSIGPVPISYEEIEERMSKIPVERNHC